MGLKKETMNWTLKSLEVEEKYKASDIKECKKRILDDLSHFENKNLSKRQVKEIINERFGDD